MLYCRRVFIPDWVPKNEFLNSVHTQEGECRALVLSQGTESYAIGNISMWIIWMDIEYIVSLRTATCSIWILRRSSNLRKLILTLSLPLFMIFTRLSISGYTTRYLDLPFHWIVLSAWDSKTTVKQGSQSLW